MNIKITILLPYLNKAETIKTYVHVTQTSLATLNIDNKILISNNNSVDNSQKLTTQTNTQIIHTPITNYNNTLLTKITKTHKHYVIITNTDNNYNLTNLQPFVNALRKNYNLIINNQFHNDITKNAIP